MTKTKWFAVCLAFAAWLLPTFASAQMPNPGEMIQLRADDARCPEGHSCFMVGEYRPGGVTRTFERMLGIVNRGRPEASHVTIEQLEAANECGVMYVRNGRPSAANGVCSRNGTTERVTFESFCGGRACARWPYANRVYRVPSVRILTPDERAEEMAREIANAVDTETVPAPASLGANLRELIELRRSSQPPTDEHEAAVLTAMADALDRTSGTAPTDMTFPELGDENVVTDDANAAELAALRSQVEQLTRERDEARGALDGRWPWWVTILACLIGMMIALFVGRWSVRRIRELDDAFPEVPTGSPSESQGTASSLASRLMVPKRELDDALERATNAERAVDNLRAQLTAVREVFEKVTGKSGATINEIGEFIRSAHQNVVFWNGSLKGLTPQSLKEEREQARLFRVMREEWTTTPRLGLQFTVENLAMMVGAWLRFDALQKVWGGMTPAFALSGASPDGGLQAYLDDHVERQIEAVRLDEAEKRRELVARCDAADELAAQLEKQRDEFARRLEEERGKNAVAPAVDVDDIKRRTLALVNERVGVKLDETLVELDRIADDSADGGVSIEKMRDEFGLVKRQKPDKLLAFLRPVLDGIAAARRELDTFLAPRETDEVVREPGRIHTPPRPMFASVPPPPSAEEASHPGLFGDGAMDDLGETAEATPIDPEKTRIARNPLLEAESGSGESDLVAESTDPFAKHPEEIRRLDEVRGNGALRGDEPTVPTKNGGRERRDTHRGFPVAASPSVPEPIALPAAVSDGSPDGE